MKQSIATFGALAVVLATSAFAVRAQTAAPAPVASGAPASVGVSPATAVEATNKAVPRSDTGTLVRTSKPAPAAARDAATNVAPSSTTAAMPAAAPAPAAVDSTMPRPARPARADRN